MSFNGGTLHGQNVGPVPGYGTSSEYAGDDGTFHDVPLGVCANGAFSGPTSQSDLQYLYIDIGNTSYIVRTQTFQITGASNFHGNINNSANLADVNVSR